MPCLFHSPSKPQAFFVKPAIGCDSGSELGEKLTKRLNELVADIATKRTAKSEATLQSEIAMFLKLAPMNLSAEDIREVTLEAQLGDGTRRRIDIEVGNCIIEVKRDLDKPATLKDAEDQLAGYMATQNTSRGVRHAGILTDGENWRLYRLIGTKPAVVSVFQLVAGSPDVEGLTVWLETILATRDQIKPTPNDIRRFLGVASNTYKLDHDELQRLYLENIHNREIQLKRHLWARLLRTALGTSFVDDAALFVDHTLLVLEASVIAHAVMGVDLTNADPRLLVSGALFRQSQLYNVIENDFFDWVVLVPGGVEFVRELTRKIRRFAWKHVEHDVLKVLYESVITAPVRKNLGEYYTPDWLAARIVEHRISSPLSQTVMDPSCGSGTFLFHAIRHHLAAADSEGLTNGEALASVQSHVYGLDIHPVSVVLARVTYLLAIGPDRLSDDRGDLTVPVYLGDSMQWGASIDAIRDDSFNVAVDSPDLASDEHQQTLFSAGEVLAFPLATISSGETFDRLVAELSHLAQSHTDPSRRRPRPDSILSSFGIVEKADVDVLKSTFNVLCDLNADHRDHVWGYFVRNQVRPLWFSFPERQVDVLVGNPPWVAYRYMTASMQAKFKRFSENRNLWTGNQLATQQDLVGLFIARCVEQYLRPGGTFAFVTPKAVLTRKQYDGFRTGKWATNLPSTLAHKSVTVRAEFQIPWDLHAIKPSVFPVPSAVVFGRRGDYAQPLPEESLLFRGSISKRAATLSAIQASLTTEAGTNAAMPVAAFPASKYAPAVFNGATVFPRYMFCVEEQERGPMGNARGIVRLKSKRSALEREPWNIQPSLEGNVESPFVHKMHLGSTLAHHRLLEPWLAVLPILDGRLLGIDEIKGHRNLSAWWEAATEVWEANKGKSKLSLMGNLDYQKKLKKQLDKGPHRVVYSASGTRLVAAYVDDPTLIIEHALYWLTVPSPEAGHYLSAILNSSVILGMVRKYQVEGLFGPRHFDKYMWQLPIPLFDPSNSQHEELSRLGKQAADVAASVNVSGMDFKKARAAIRAELTITGIEVQIEALVESLIGLPALPLENATADQPILVQ